VQVFTGICLSPGVAIGPAYRFVRDRFVIPDKIITTDDVESELARFKSAILKATAELEEIRALLAHQLDENHARMIDAQLMTLTDSDLLSIVENSVRQQHHNIIRAYYEAMNQYEALLTGSGHSYQQQRLVDLHDVKRRVVHHLSVTEDYGAPQLIEPAIFISERITPSDIINIYQQNALGVITQQGGRDSHAAILARAFGLPYLSEVADLDVILHSQEIILSADEGKIILEAPVEIRREYYRRVQTFNRERQMTALRTLKPISRDNITVNLLANVGFLSEVEPLANTLIGGIGLFRTEYLCIQNSAIPDEEKQFATYRAVVEAMHGKPVTFRTFDFGRDKLLSILNLSISTPSTATMLEGGIRFCLANPNLLRTQLRALLRASNFGSVQIMFPLVFNFNDVVQALQILNDVKGELHRNGIPFAPHLPVGIMVETDQILPELTRLVGLVDFFSIGTNDLALYLLKTDRQKSASNSYYEPKLLNAIAQILTVGESLPQSVTVCGEMAADPLAALGLLALGVRSLSVNPIAVYPLVRLIRKLSMKKLDFLRTALLQAQTAAETQALLKNWLENSLKPK